MSDAFQRLVALRQATQHLEQPQPLMLGVNDPFTKNLQQGLDQPVLPRGQFTNRDALTRLLDLLPGIGDMMAAEEGLKALKDKSYGMAALNFASTIPAIGDIGTLFKLSAPSLAGAGLLLRQMAQRSGDVPVTPFTRQSGVIGYHGSPHKFDKFDLSKIGTGEGAQAYGHGLYFAENPKVAKQYQIENSRYGELYFSDGSKVYAPDLPKAQRVAAEALIRNPDPEDAKWAVGNYDKKYLGVSVEDVNKAIDDFAERGARTSGAFYKVDIPDKYVDNFLDWDKPLSEQPKQVRESLYSVMDKMYPDLAKYHRQAEKLDDAGRAALRKKMGINIFDAEAGVGAIYESLGNPTRASDMLNKAGIKGIRYLDQGSRTAGKGTSNFVVFDDSIIKMLERNGEGVIGSADEAADLSRRIGEIQAERQAKAVQFNKIRSDQGDTAETAQLIKDIRHLDSKAEKLSGRLKQAQPPVETSYRGSHEAPSREVGASLDDLSNIYPDDIYSHNAVRYYGTYGDNSLQDWKSIRKIQAMRGKPNELVYVWRAVPKDAPSRINKGDWVTINRDYAVEHGQSALNGKYKIVRQKVKAGDLFTTGDSIHEWGYDPE